MEDGMMYRKVEGDDVYGGEAIEPKLVRQVVNYDKTEETLDGLKVNVMQKCREPYWNTEFGKQDRLNQLEIVLGESRRQDPNFKIRKVYRELEAQVEKLKGELSPVVCKSCARDFETLYERGDEESQPAYCNDADCSIEGFSFLEKLAMSALFSIFTAPVTGTLIGAGIGVKNAIYGGNLMDITKGTLYGCGIGLSIFLAAVAVGSADEEDSVRVHSSR